MKTMENFQLKKKLQWEKPPKVIKNKNLSFNIFIII